MADVYIKLDQLRSVQTDLDSIIEEFSNATDRSEALEESIGDPFGRAELREHAQDFEERWDVKREKLKEELTGVRDHVQAVVETVEEADAEAAIALEPEE